MISELNALVKSFRDTVRQNDLPDAWLERLDQIDKHEIISDKLTILALVSCDLERELDNLATRRKY